MIKTGLTRHACRVFGLALGVFIVCVSSAFAAYPERPIKIIVPLRPVAPMI
jgi:tripartite-type tricarboxylate transporter receptor subunit TctC